MAKTVVVVHDDAERRADYCKVLWYNGFDVEIADSASAASAVAQAGAIDLVLLGLSGRSTTGLELCQALASARQGRGVPVLVVAARAELDVARAARLAGCAGYVEEPAAAVEVLFAVERVIGRAQPEDADEPEPEPPREVRAPEPAPAPLRAVVTPASAPPPLRLEPGRAEPSGPRIDPATGPPGPAGAPPEEPSPS